MLTTTIERLADDKLRLDVEVPAAEVDAAVEHTLADMARTVRLPGFRPGKVPPAAVLARMGREHVVAESVSSHLDDWYRSAVAASGIRPVAAPDVDLGAMPTQGQAFTFSATIEVAKPPKLPEISKLEVERPKRPDTAPLLAQVLEATLRGAGTLVESSEPAGEGDEVVVDFTCSVEGQDV
jgi:trigger factor